MMKSLTLILSTLTLAACASDMPTETRPAVGSVTPASENYDQKIDRYSDGRADYAGFYNNFEYKATILNSYIRGVVLDRQSSYYEWAPEKLQKEKEKANREMAAETDVFMSFFTPSRENDNLTRDKTIWRVYLDAGGHRYEGSVKKVHLLLAELQALYPYHTRWNSPYVVTFSVPTTAIENQSATMTITSPLGSKTVSFKAMQ
jgi:hypothetical protein